MCRGLSLQTKTIDNRKYVMRVIEGLVQLKIDPLIFMNRLQRRFVSLAKTQLKSTGQDDKIRLDIKNEST